MEEVLFYQLHASYPVPESLKGEIFSNGKPVEHIENTNKVNLFVGANNSGKSRIIRELMKSDHKSYRLVDFVIAQLEKKRSDLSQKVVLLFQQLLGNTDLENFKYFENGAMRTIFSKENLSQFWDYDLHQKTMNFSFIDGFLEIIKKSISFPAFYNGRTVLDRNQSVSTLKQLSDLIVEWKDELEKKKYLENNSPFVYIPSIRSLRSFASIANLKAQIAAEYSIQLSSLFHRSIETGEDFYSTILNYQKSKFAERRRKKELESFLKENFFNGKDVEITSVEEDRKGTGIHIKIGNEKEQPIQNLGDGLQMIIIMTLPFFAYDCGTIAIEEPELYIHPGLQRKFMDFLLNHPRTKNFQIFIATHSNHFLDTTINSDLISVFNVSKRFDGTEGDEVLPKFNVENVAFGDQNSLTLLGVNNTSVYLSNCTIWVEGITDKLYLGKYIEQYVAHEKNDENLKLFKNYYEGIHYSFVLSAGDNIIHWEFDDDAKYEELKGSIIVKNLCGKAFVIVDNDYGKNIERKKKLEEILGHAFYELPVPEIENLLNIDQILKIIRDYPTIAKIEEAEIKIPNDDERKSLKLGTLIDEHYLKGLPGKKFANSEAKGDKGSSLKSGDKADFCNKALHHITYATMTQEAKDAARKIIEFVVSQNKDKSN